MKGGIHLGRSAKSQLVLGLMSGTSADGVSVALIRVHGRALKALSHATYPYPRALRGRILAAIHAKTPELSRLNFELGRVFADAASKFLRSRKIRPKRLAAVGSHGQTVVHLPDDPIASTLQIGEPSFLAEALGVPVVSDFRPRDMSAGGQGAPLAPFLDEFLFGKGPARILQNIGGIANAALVGRNLETLAFDTGPGNCLIDEAVRRISHGRRRFDKNGQAARRGRIHHRKVRSLLHSEYFHRPPPKSLDRSAFAGRFLDEHFAFEIGRTPADAIATLTYFTALSIVDAYRRFIFPKASIDEVVVSGGGALNPVLMGHLRRLLAPVPVVSIAKFGIPPLAKEPAAIALMALRAVQRKVNHAPKATGAAGPRILGKITPSSDSQHSERRPKGRPSG